MHRFLIIIEKAGNNYSVYSPDLPGCVATGKTRSQAENNMQSAIALHLEGMLEDELAIPKSQSYAEYIVLPKIKVRRNKISS